MRWIVVAALGMLVGCASPRFVSIDEAGGVVALPDNTNCWPCYHRDKADALIKQRYPQGYLILKEEEVVVGTRSTTTGQTQTQEAPTLLLGGGNSQSSNSGRSASGSFGAIALPVGQTQQDLHQTTTTVNQTEYRIFFKAK